MPQKMELMWFGSSAAVNSLLQSDLTIKDRTEIVHPVTMVRDLGVHLDNELTSVATLYRGMNS